MAMTLYLTFLMGGCCQCGFGLVFMHRQFSDLKKRCALDAIFFEDSLTPLSVQWLAAIFKNKLIHLTLGLFRHSVPVFWARAYIFSFSGGPLKVVNCGSTVFSKLFKKVFVCLLHASIRECNSKFMAEGAGESGLTSSLSGKLRCLPMIGHMLSLLHALSCNVACLSATGIFLHSSQPVSMHATFWFCCMWNECVRPYV